MKGNENTFRVVDPKRLKMKVSAGRLWLRADCGEQKLSQRNGCFCSGCLSSVEKGRRAFPFSKRQSVLIQWSLQALRVLLRVVPVARTWTTVSSVLWYQFLCSKLQTNRFYRNVRRVSLETRLIISISGNKLKKHNSNDFVVYVARRTAFQGHRWFRRKYLSIFSSAAVGYFNCIIIDTMYVRCTREKCVLTYKRRSMILRTVKGKYFLLSCFLGVQSNHAWNICSFRWNQRR